MYIHCESCFYVIIFLTLYTIADIGSSQEAIGLSDVAIEVLHLLLTYLNNCQKADLNIKPEDEAAFLDSLRRGQLFGFFLKAFLCSGLNRTTPGL